MTVGLNGLKVANITPYGVPLPNSVEITATYPSADEADFDGTPGVAGATQWKEPVRAATTASITIATALNAGDTLDGVTLAAGDRVLVKNQGTAKENGIYVVDATPYRAGDMDDDAEVLGAVVYVVAGTTNHGTSWAVTNTGATVVDTDAINWAAFGGSGTSGGTDLGWFVVTDPTYGAVGDGTTDDTSAINAAIADLNTATAGVLYFPAGTYKVTSALTTITASGMALGDGGGSYDNAVGASRINCTSQTAVLFTVSAKAFRFEKLGFVNTYAGTPSAGAAILVDSAYLEQRVDYADCTFQGFYDNVDVKVGAQWAMRGCFNIAPVRYGLRIRNTVNVDAGDWSISDCAFSAQTYNSTSAIRVESSGGGKIVNTKINMALDSKRFATGIDIAIGSGVSTSVFTFSANSIENVSGDAISVTTTSTGVTGLITIAGLQVGLYSNNSGRAVKLTAASTGGITTSGGLGVVVIDGLVARTDGTARAAVELTNTDRVTLGQMAYVGFNARYTSSGDTNTTDTMAEPVAAAHIADTSAAHAASAISVADSGGYFTGTDVEAVLAELAVAVPTGHYEVIVSGSAPPVAVTNEAEDDWLYGWVED